MARQRSSLNGSCYCTPSFQDNELPHVEEMYPALANLKHLDTILATETSAVKPLYPSSSMLSQNKDDEDSLDGSDRSGLSELTDDSALRDESAKIKTSPKRGLNRTRQPVQRHASLSKLAAMRQALEKQNSTTENNNDSSSRSINSAWSHGKAEHMTPPRRSIWKDSRGKSRYISHDHSDLRVLRRRVPPRRTQSQQVARRESWANEPTPTTIPLTDSNPKEETTTTASSSPVKRSPPRRTKSLLQRVAAASNKIVEHHQKVQQQQKEQEEAIKYAKAFVAKYNNNSSSNASATSQPSSMNNCTAISA